jgi:hypothetical protein
VPLFRGGLPRYRQPVRFPPATALVLTALLLLPAAAGARTRHRPKVLAAAVTSTTVTAGADGALSIRARDHDAPVYGYSVQALGGSAMGLSACSVQVRHGRAVDTTGRKAGTIEAFTARFRFDTPGRHALVVRVNSGGCVPGQRGEVSAPFLVWVDVLPAPA